MFHAGGFAGQHAGGLVPFLAEEWLEEENFEERICRIIWYTSEGYQIDQEEEARCL